MSASLAAVVVESAPEGYVLEMDGELGPNLELPPPRNRPLTDIDLATLRRFGYRRGYARSWIAADGPSGVGVFVFEFDTPSGADQYDASSRIAMSMLGFESFDVDGSRDALVWPGDSGVLTLGSVVGGRYVGVVQAGAPTRDSAVELTREFLRQQASKFATTAE